MNLHRFAIYTSLKMNRLNLEHIWKMNDFENGNRFEKWTIFKMGTVLKKEVFNKWSNLKMNKNELAQVCNLCELEKWTDLKWNIFENWTILKMGTKLKNEWFSRWERFWKKTFLINDQI
jgi:hypothetical protein